MSVDFDRELENLARLGTRELRLRYREVFGEASCSGNKAWLFKRIAWRLQALAGGTLSQRALCRAQELARDADVRLLPPREASTKTDLHQNRRTTLGGDADRRLPRPGTTIRRKYKGKLIEVLVVPAGFEFEGELYTSLSAIAKPITGGHCNGLAFFKLPRKGSTT